jgi:hypothetical protein
VKPYVPSNEMMWRPDENVVAARKLPGWVEFHRTCGRAGLFFDNPTRDGRRGKYTVTAFGVRPVRTGFQHVHFADGQGTTVVEALEAAYRAAGQLVADAEMDLLMGRAADDFSALIGGDSDFEDLIG